MGDFFWKELGFNAALDFYEQYIRRSAHDVAKRRAARRDLAQNDLFFLLAYVCKRRDLIHPWLFARCREVQADPDGYLDLWAREHYKSTIITFGQTLLDIINNQEITIGLFSHTRDISLAFLRQLKREMETNKDLVDLFPEIFWENPIVQAPKWGDEGLTVKRKDNPKEATIEAWGLVRGMPTSKHYKLRVYDDVVTKDSVSNPDQIKATTDAWRLSTNLKSKGGTFRVIGTRYHEFDTYHTMIKEKVVKVRQHPCTLNGDEVLDEGALMERKDLEERYLEQGRRIFGAQMLLNPSADKSKGFLEEWLKYWEPSFDAAKRTFRIILVDPSSGKHKKDGQNERRDYTCAWVMGLGQDNIWRGFDLVRDRLNLGQRQAMVEDLHRLWEPRFVFYEETGFEADMDYFKIKMKENVYDMEIVPIRWSISKDDRIQNLAPMFEAGRIMLPRTIVKINNEKKAEDVIKTFVEEEYLTYPVVVHDDGLDDLANLNHPEVLKRVRLPRKTDEQRAKIAEAKKLMRGSRPVV